MDCKIGQEYKQRNGKIVTVVATSAKGLKPIVVQGPGDHDVSLRYPDGSSMGPGLNAPDDLLGEYVPLVECVALVRKTDGVLVGVKPPHNAQTDEEWAAAIAKAPHDAPNSGFRIVKLREIEP